MSLIFETGTGDPLAESYCSVAVADAYFRARGDVVWNELPSSRKEQCLRLATDYLLGYSTRWRGFRLSTTQALDWPRLSSLDIDTGYAYPSNVVPIEIQRATAELALRANSGPLTPDQGGAGAIKSRTVGPITTVYQDSAVSGPKFRSVDAMLAKFLVGGGGMSIPLVRA